MEKKDKHIKDCKKLWRARAANLGSWLVLGSNGAWALSKNYEESFAFEDEPAAKKAWSVFCMEETARRTLAKANVPNYLTREPSLKQSMDISDLPTAMRMFIVVCNGRFVALEHTYNDSIKWVLDPDMSKAHVFTDETAALGHACRRGLGGKPSSVVELRAVFIGSKNAPDYPGDALAGALGVGSERAQLSAAVEDSKIANSNGSKKYRI